MGNAGASLQMLMARDPGLILIVDDDYDLRESLRAILEDEGFATMGASDGEEAFELLQREGQPPFQLVLLDLMLPKMTGLDLAERMQKDCMLGTIPVVLMTAFRTLVRSGEKLPVLLKPLHIDGILAAIRQAC